MSQHLKLVAYLAHVRRADGSWPSDWVFAQLSLNGARQVLRQHLTNARLPHQLTVKAYAASEELRSSSPPSADIPDWQALRSQVIRVVPVVLRLLRTLAESSRTP